MFQPCVVIPVYNHEHAIDGVVEGALACGLHCVLVDDGSSPPCAQALVRLAAAHPERVSLVVHAANRGKGDAVLSGLAHAARLGYSHAVQIDADGQHKVADIGRFVERARAEPRAMIVGQPQYDESVPKGRLYSRYLTHVWVWINTLSLDIHDSMCGFRVYPIAPVLALAQRVKLGSRMDFDTEVLVRLHWSGMKMVNLLTPVRYPVDGVSHFRMVMDNVLISRMHTVLFFGMLARLPQLLWRRWRPA